MLSLRHRRWRFAGSRAAVAIVLRALPDGSYEVLLTLRAHRPGDRWSGHVSFPGGRAEAADKDSEATAIRETLEELGFELPPASGRLDSLLTMRHGSWRPMAVDPIVFRVSERPEFVLNHEVEEVFWASLAELRSGRLDIRHPWRLGPREISMPAWRVQGHTVWGLTHTMLRRLLDQTLP